MKHNEICVRAQGSELAELQRLGIIPGLFSGIGSMVKDTAAAGVMIANCVQENKRANERLKMEQENHSKRMVMMNVQIEQTKKMGEEALQQAKLNTEQQKADMQWIATNRANQLAEYKKAVEKAELTAAKTAVAQQWKPWLGQLVTHENVLSALGSGFGAFAMLIDRLGGLDKLMTYEQKRQIDFVLAQASRVLDEAKKKAIPAPLKAVLNNLLTADFGDSNKKREILWQLEYLKDGTRTLANMLDNIIGYGTGNKYQRAAQYALFQLNGGAWFDMPYLPTNYDGVNVTKVEYKAVAEDILYEMVRDAKIKLVKKYYGDSVISAVGDSLMTQYAGLQNKLYGNSFFYPIWDKDEDPDMVQFEKDLADLNLLRVTNLELESGLRAKRLWNSLAKICEPMYQKIKDILNSYKDYSGGLTNAPSLFRTETDVKQTLRSMLLTDSSIPANKDLLQRFLDTLDDAVRKSKVDFAFSPNGIPAVVRGLLENQKPHIAGLLLKYLVDTVLVKHPYKIYRSVEAEQPIEGGYELCAEVLI